MHGDSQIASMGELADEMTAHFHEFEAEYRENDWSEIVYEDEDTVVLADHKGYELTEWGNEIDDYGAVSEHMHERANELCDYNWSTSYPVVFDK